MEDNEKLLRSFLSEDAFFLVNKKLLRMIGMAEAFYLTNLISWNKFCEDKGWMQEGGFFYREREKIEEDLGIKHTKQKIINNKLKKMNLLETKRGRVGNNIKVVNLYKINYLELNNLLCSSVPRIGEIRRSESAKSADCTISNNNSNKNNTCNNKLLQEQGAQPLVNSEQAVSYREKNIYLNFWESLKEKFPGAKLSLHAKYLKRNGNYVESKSHKDCIRFLKRLERGGFDEFKFDSEFLKRNHIKKSLLSKKWTAQEIKLNLERLALLRVPGIHPFPDKNKIPKDLKGLIYNSVKGTSFFFAVAMHPPYLKNEGKTDEQLNNEKDYKTTGVISFSDLQRELDRVDEMWRKVNPKIEKKRRLENW